MSKQTKPPKKIIDYDTSRLGRLHCDAPGCGYIAPEASPWGPELVGTPCPACGANLLTASDYARVQRSLRFIDKINRIFGPLFGRREMPPDALHMSIRMHGNQTDINFGPRTGDP